MAKPEVTVRIADAPGARALLDAVNILLLAAKGVMECRYDQDHLFSWRVRGERLLKLAAAIRFAEQGGMDYAAAEARAWREQNAGPTMAPPSCPACPMWKRLADDMRRDIGTLEDRLRQTRTALQQYGRHKSWCAGCDPAKQDDFCTCGLNDALNPPAVASAGDRDTATPDDQRTPPPQTQVGTDTEDTRA